VTEEEEALFRQAAREALAASRDVLIVGADDPEAFPLFSVVRFGAGKPVAIVIPIAWETMDGMEERYQGILRQESKALAGQRLD
jgi:hypothetical protein